MLITIYFSGYVKLKFYERVVTMKNLKFKKIFSGLIAGVVAVSMCTISAFAVSHSLSTDDAAKFTENESLSQAASSIGLQVNDREISVSDTSKLADMGEKDQQAAMDNFITELANAGVSQEGTNEISAALSEGYDGVAGVKVDLLQITYIFGKTQGDLLGAMGIISPFLPLINLIIGVVAIVVAAILVLSTVIDLAFIGLPMVRESMMAGDGEKQGSGAKPKALTYACWATINDVEGALGGGGSMGGGSAGGKSYKNAYGLYFKRRLWDYILLGVCLSFLIFGGFGRLMGSLLKIGDQLVGG